MGTQADTEFNVLQFEKQLSSLKDSQDSINLCCQWCLQNRQHHKKIVNAWLNVLKRVKVEQRLILFYLANDVVQYSKRRNYEYVESWGTALQKATTLVRDERVKHKILRIFKIWEQRGVYGEEFISDLCGLISVTPSGPKSDEPHEFQPTYVINKIKNCANLERDTDAKLKVLQEHNPKIQIGEGLITSLKDRAHVDDVEKEVEVYVKHMENYINALKLEIKNRIALISVLRQSETQLESDRKDVKLVAHAYKMFGTRVKTFQKKLEEHKATLPSPVPSPDINAPSPSPDSDLDFPEEDSTATTTVAISSGASATDFDTTVQYTNAGYYNPVPPPVCISATTESSNSFLTNGFTSFLGSNMPFDLQNINSSSLFGSTLGTSTPNNTQTTNSSYSTVPAVLPPPPLPVEAPPTTTSTHASGYSYSTGHLPLLPPPMPPFTKSDTGYSSASYSTTLGGSAANSQFAPTYQQQSPAPTYNASVYTPDTDTSFAYDTPDGSNPYPPTTDTSNPYSPTADGSNTYPSTADGSNHYPPTTEEYNPEHDIETWADDPTWQPTKDTDTPESPPMFEKEGYGDPVEYHDNTVAQSGAVDVDQRVLPGMGDLDDSLSSLGGKDVDHRNLISLTGSPADTTLNVPTSDDLWNQSDQDYRSIKKPPTPHADRDYRSLNFSIENLNLPPPPPPPPKPLGKEQLLAAPPPPPPDPRKHLLPTPQIRSKSPRKSDNVDNIDMDLSDDDIENRLKLDNRRSVTSDEQIFCLEPPPPFPDLPDDVDANNFLDEISNDLSEFSNLSGDLNQQTKVLQEVWNKPPPGPPPLMNFGIMNAQMDVTNPPPMPPMHMDPNNWMQGGDQPPPMPWMQVRPGLPLEEDNPYLLPDDDNPYLQGEEEPDWASDDMRQNNFRGRGRGNFRGNFNNNWTENGGRGRGRGNFRGGNNFRGRGNQRGGHRGGGGFRQKGNFRGNFRGGF